MDGIADSPNTVLGFLWVRLSGLSGGLTRGVLQFVCKLRRGNVGILILRSSGCFLTAETRRRRERPPRLCASAVIEFGCSPHTAAGPSIFKFSNPQIFKFRSLHHLLHKQPHRIRRQHHITQRHYQRPISRSVNT